jgi:transposase-like protein
MTKKKQYRRYSPEFKRAALKRAAEEDVTDVQVCKELGIILMGYGTVLHRQTR